MDKLINEAQMSMNEILDRYFSIDGVSHPRDTNQLIDLLTRLESKEVFWTDRGKPSAAYLIQKIERDPAYRFNVKVYTIEDEDYSYRLLINSCIECYIK